MEGGEYAKENRQFHSCFCNGSYSLPLRVHAEESTGTVNETTGREAGPAGNRQVAVMVYGESITEIATRKNYTFRDFQAALKRELQGVLASEKPPDVEMYLVNDQNQEYKLTKDAVPDAAFLSSFKYRAYGLIGYSEYIYSWIQGICQWLVSDGETYGEFYRIYGATNVPEGDYTL